MELAKDDVVKVLNEIVELELAGAVRYTQYSLMVFGHARIPIMSWMREQATEALLPRRDGRRGGHRPRRPGLARHRRAGGDPPRARSTR